MAPRGGQSPARRAAVLAATLAHRERLQCNRLTFPTTVADMRHDDILDDVWRIPQAPREKDAGGDLVLPKLALNVIAEQPRHAVNRHVFPEKWGPATFMSASTR